MRQGWERAGCTYCRENSERGQNDTKRVCQQYLSFFLEFFFLAQTGAQGVTQCVRRSPPNYLAQSLIVQPPKLHSFCSQTNTGHASNNFKS